MARHPCCWERWERGIDQNRNESVTKNGDKWRYPTYQAWQLVTISDSQKSNTKLFRSGRQPEAGPLTPIPGWSGFFWRKVNRLLAMQDSCGCSSQWKRKDFVKQCRRFRWTCYDHVLSHFHNKFMLISWARLHFQIRLPPPHSKCLNNLNINLNVSTIWHKVGKLSN